MRERQKNFLSTALIISVLSVTNGGFHLPVCPVAVVVPEKIRFDYQGLQRSLDIHIVDV